MFSLIQRVRSYNDLSRSDSDVDLVGKVTESEMKRVGSNPEMDPEVEPNKNIAWVRGEALITFYVGILVFLRVFTWLLSLSPHVAWTFINLTHCIVSKIFSSISYFSLASEANALPQPIANNFSDYFSFLALGERCTVLRTLERSRNI